MKSMHPMTRPPFFILLVATLISVSGLLRCAAADQTEELQFVVAPWLIQGGGRPNAPQNLRVSYNAFAQAIDLAWEPAIDPALGIPVYEYRIYLYLDAPPRDYYREGDLFDTSAVNFYSVESDPFSGALYFVVTAWNGGAESFPSNTAALSLL